MSTTVSKISISMAFPITYNDSPQDALEFEYRIGVQIYKLVRFCISDTFGNPLTPNETMWWYNLLIAKKPNSK